MSELQTCIYDHVPHECEHWIDDAEYHAVRGEEPCIPAPTVQGVEW